MSSQTNSVGPVDRRQFLKIAGATSLTLGLAGCTGDGDGTPTETETPTATEEPPEKLPETVVGETVETSYMVDHQGPVETQINDEGVVHSVSYLEEDFMKPCVEGAGYRSRTYAPARIKYPMKRKGWEPGNPSPEGRGKDEFVRISWDEAASLVADEYERIRDEYGDEAVFAGSYGWQSKGSLGNAIASLHRLLNLTGGYIDDSETYSTAAMRVSAPYTYGTHWPPLNNAVDVKQNSDLVVWWATDPEVLGDIWSESTHSKFIQDLDEEGVDQIHINPKVTESQLVTDAEHIPIRQNTDTAMMAAVCHTLLEEDLHDQEFLDEYTVGFEDFKQYILGGEDGQPKTPEWAEEITEVPADSIRDLARRMANNRTFITMGWVLQRMDHGEQPVRMLGALGAMLGQIGLPGGGVNYAFLEEGLGLTSFDGTGPGGFPVPSNPLGGEQMSDSSIPVAHIAEMLKNPGGEYQYDGGTWTYPDIELVHWAGGNPFSHHQDTNDLLEAWRKPETIIVNEINWTATAEHADIVLPAVTRMEAPDIASWGRAVFANQQPIEPLFEAKDDYEIHRLIAEEMGVGMLYTEGNSRMDWIESFYEATDVPMSFDEFWEEEGYYLYDLTGEPSSAWEDWREDPNENPMDTPSGLLEITSSQLEEYDLDDCPATPKWIEPGEWLGADKASEYPFHLSTPHPRRRLHSQFDNVPLLRKHMKVANREPVWINAQDAEEKGIEDGDVVRVWNDRGQTLAGAIVTERMKPNHVALSYGSWWEPEEPGETGSLGLDGNANLLTKDNHTSSLAQGPDVDSQLVNIEKYGGDL